MQKIPWNCKFNVLFIWYEVAAISALNFKFQVGCLICWKTFKNGQEIPIKLYYTAKS